MKRFSPILIFLFLTVALVGTTSCNRDAHCPAYNNLHEKTGKDGRLKTKGGKTNLFPKKMRRN